MRAPAHSDGITGDGDVEACNVCEEMEEPCAEDVQFVEECLEALGDWANDECLASKAEVVELLETEVPSLRALRRRSCDYRIDIHVDAGVSCGIFLKRTAFNRPASPAAFP